MGNIADLFNRVEKRLRKVEKEVEEVSRERERVYMTLQSTEERLIQLQTTRRVLNRIYVNSKRNR